MVPLNSIVSCNTIPILFLRCDKSICLISCPSINNSPSFKSKNLGIKLINVLFPAPDKPTSAMISPFFADIEIFSSAYPTFLL